MLVLHVCVLVPTFSGVTTIWAGRAVVPPLFDRKTNGQLQHPMSVLTTTRVESVYLTSTALTNLWSGLLWSASS